MPFTVTVPQLKARFEVGDDETIVEAATAQGVPFPFSCHSGTCGTCKSRLVSGDVTMLDHYSKFTLTDKERESGLILACCAIPQSDCEVAPVPQSPIPARKLTCTVAALRDATHDIKILEVEPPGGVPLRFLAGQYADLTFGGLPARSYSMASKPGDSLLEFHVRRTGQVSQHIHSSVKPGDKVTINAPIGTSYLRDEHKGPVLAVAGGSGLGPIKSILDTIVSRPSPPPIHFYFGVRDGRDLYYADHFRDLEAKGLLSFVPVLSEPAGATTARTGFLADAIKSDFGTLGGFKAYLAGPPIMVETCLAAITASGLDLTDCHADAF
jgi:CDP-4-dehydro-6-deoxyglucose reductase/ferredoxin-NAD(P)+ reductase (naphthalene dioxygenase ferredoxin-specific)